MPEKKNLSPKEIVLRLKDFFINKRLYYYDDITREETVVKDVYHENGVIVFNGEPRSIAVFFNINFTIIIYLKKEDRQNGVFSGPPINEPTVDLDNREINLIEAIKLALKN